jgi:hypothetical protein
MGGTGGTGGGTGGSLAWKRACATGPPVLGLMFMRVPMGHMGGNGSAPDEVPVRWRIFQTH